MSINTCHHVPAHPARANSIGHAVVRSLEPGEDWMWCYEDERQAG
jgi:hypothetical protein